MRQDVNPSSNSSVSSGSGHPVYEPPVVIDYGSVAALTLGGGEVMGSDAWGSAGGGGDS